jgi:hypothetical protein
MFRKPWDKSLLAGTRWVRELSSQGLWDSLRRVMPWFVRVLSVPRGLSRGAPAVGMIPLR